MSLRKVITLSDHRIDGLEIRIRLQEIIEEPVGDGGTDSVSVSAIGDSSQPSSIN
jgi:hypothetical protein